MLSMIKNSDKKQPSLAIGLLGCFGGLFVHLVIGSLYQWGIINIYMTSYFHLVDESLTVESTALVFPIMMICIGISMRLGLYLAEITHPLIVLFAVQVLQALSIFISSYMSTFWTFILFYGIIFGLLAGNNFVLPMDECNRYLVGKKMIVNGIILMGTGLGSVVFGEFSYNFINPDKIAPLNGYYIGTPQLEDIAHKSPTLIKWLSLLYLGIGLIGSLMLAPVCLHNRRVKKQQQHRKRNQKTNQNSIQHQNSRISQTQNPANPISHQIVHQHPNHLTRHQRKHLREAHSIIQAFQSKIFWVSLFILMLSSCGCFMISGNYKTYVKTKIQDDQYLTTIGVVAAVGNGCSRFLWNLFFSKTGYKTVLLSILTIAITVLATIRFSTDYPGAYLFEVFLVNCCLGGYLVSAPTAALSIYGHTTGANIYCFYWQNFALANMIGYIYVSQLTKKIGFDNTIYVCLGMAVLAVPLVLLTKYQGPWQNDTVNLEYCLGIEMEKKRQQEQKNNSTNPSKHTKQRKESFQETLQQKNTHESKTKEVLKHSSTIILPKLQTKKQETTKVELNGDSHNESMQHLNTGQVKYNQMHIVAKKDTIVQNNN